MTRGCSVRDNDRQEASFIPRTTKITQKATWWPLWHLMMSALTMVMSLQTATVSSAMFRWRHGQLASPAACRRLVVAGPLSSPTHSGLSWWDWATCNSKVGLGQSCSIFFPWHDKNLGQTEWQHYCMLSKSNQYISCPQRDKYFSIKHNYVYVMYVGFIYPKHNISLKCEWQFMY